MAFDTEQKRSSVLTFDDLDGMAWPTGLNDQAYRQDVMAWYAGILVDVAVAESDTPNATIIKLGTKTWKFLLSGTAPFTLYGPGGQIGAETSETSIILEGDDDYEPPLLQILDSASTDTVYETENPSVICLQWRGDSSHSYYEVQESVAGTWTHRRIMVENGQGYYEYQTLPLDDVTTATWRVLAYDSQENVGRSMEFNVLVVRNPEPPVVWITYNAVTGNATVSAR